MKKYLWLVLAILIPASLYAGTIMTGQANTLVHDFIFAIRGLSIGGPITDESTLLSIHGQDFGVHNGMKVNLNFLPSFPLQSEISTGTTFDYSKLTECNATTCNWAGMVLEPTVNNPSAQHLGQVMGYAVWPTINNNGNNQIDAISMFDVAPIVTNTGGGIINNFVGFDIDLTANSGVFCSRVVAQHCWGIAINGNDQAGQLLAGIQNNLPGITIIGSQNTSTTNAPVTSLIFEGVTFANLSAAPNGTIAYCTDCNATCAAGASTGKFCKREAGAWAAM